MSNQDVKRYDLENRSHGYEPDYQMYESKYGDWVKFSDYESLRAQLERVREETLEMCIQRLQKYKAELGNDSFTTSYRVAIHHAISELLDLKTKSMLAAAGGSE